MFRRFAFFALSIGCVAAPGEPLGQSQQAIGGSGLVVNECATGTGGYIELYNGGGTTLDLTNDSSLCWFVDDINGGGAPKRITDAVVNHAAGSTTCSALGRSATCGVVAPGEVVWVPYSYVNAASADECRLITAAKSAGTCSTTYSDESAGGLTSSTVAGTCFGRASDGGAWLPGAIACSKGTTNGPACVVGATCDDGNACTSGDALDATCTCHGSAITCDDGNTCTSDACDTALGCITTPLADGVACGTGSSCRSGVCTVDPPPPPPATDATIVRAGAADKILLRGTVIGPSGVYPGEVLIEGNLITCAATSCSEAPGAATATIVATNGIIAPGMIDTHNHILFDIFDETDWVPPKIYANHNQWPNDAKYKAMVDAKQYLNGEYGSSVNVGCEMNKYGELKGLIAGTTSIVGAANPANKICYSTVARTIDQSSNGLGYDKMQVATLFPTTSSADSVCSGFSSGSTNAYLVHVGEGVDETSRNEFDKLFSVSSVDGCLHAPQTAIVHGTAFGAPEFDRMAAARMSLVWSPQSNVFLYGGNTDLSKTTNIPLAMSKGINVALAPDWSIGGSQNLLDELRFAKKIDTTAWGSTLGSKTLFEMVTIRAARIAGVSDVLGSIEVGKRADIMVIGGDASAPYDAVIGATPRDVRLVMVDGVARYGDSALKPLGPATPGCDDLAICGATKFACIAVDGGTSTNKLGQNLGDIKTTLETELQKYDDLNLTSWDFMPIAPLVKCPATGS
jgi:5-methylthioadenosine/S-adenosylhomocysteine deaminase